MSIVNTHHMSPQSVRLSRRHALQATAGLAVGLGSVGCLSGAPPDDDEGRARIGRLSLLNRDPRPYDVTVRVGADGETVHESTHALPARSDDLVTRVELSYATDEARAYVVEATTDAGAADSLDVGEVENPCEDDCHCVGVHFEVHERSVKALLSHPDDCA